MHAKSFRSAVSTGFLVLAACVCLGFGSGNATTSSMEDEELEGRAPTPVELAPGVAASFARESYAPGAVARLSILDGHPGLPLQVFRSGPELGRTRGTNELRGVPMTRPRAIGATRAGAALSVRVGDWPSGLYYGRLTAGGGLAGFAPFVVRPRRLGGHRVAVVLPTMTWQAYNLRDDDHDGVGDSWYAAWRHHTVRLGRPFLNRGVPPCFRRYDLPFLHWLAREGKQVDVLSDAELRTVRTGDVLDRAYDLIVFPGHHEYVTAHEYDVVERYRDLGGHLAFLSANNFFWEVVKRGDMIERTKQWRELGRPESGLLGVEYRGNDRGGHRAPWIVRHVEATPWLFEGTGLVDGDPLGNAGIEIDRTAAHSPRGVRVLAEIPDLFGPGFTAQMTYYETPRGAKVFAAGAFTIAGSAANPVVSRLLANLWTERAGDEGPRSPAGR